MFAVDSARLVPTRMLPEGLSSTPAFESQRCVETYEEKDADLKPSAGSYDGDLCFEDERLAEKSDENLLDIIAACDIDHSLPPSKEFAPTIAAASAALSDFVAHSLKTYPYRRNNAADEGGISRLSPYLHFGLIGPRTISKAVRAADVPANASGIP